MRKYALLVTNDGENYYPKIISEKLDEVLPLYKEVVEFGHTYRNSKNFIVYSDDKILKDVNIFYDGSIDSFLNSCWSIYKGIITLSYNFYMNKKTKEIIYKDNLKENPEFDLQCELVVEYNKGVQSRPFFRVII